MKRFCRLLVVVLLVAQSPGATNNVHAAACCMSSSASGIGRLAIWESFAIGWTNSFVGTVGHWDLDGRWQGNSADFKEFEWRTELWSLIGLGRKTLIYARLPMMLTRKRAGGTLDIGGGIADPVLGVRYEIFSIGEYQYVPALAVNFGLTFPAGKTTSSSTVSKLGANVTGRGAWVLNFGISVEKTKLPWFVRFDIGIKVPMPQWRGDIQKYQRYGMGLELAFVAGWEVTRNLVLSLIPEFSWEDSVLLDKKAVKNSTRRELAIAFAISWKVDPHWTVQASFRSGILASHVGDNNPGRISGSLGLRYGYF